ncbi:MAG TPA: MFS transporter [Bacilli bacterium]|nr:MFS transporter [Bacilli bacterium]
MGGYHRNFYLICGLAFCYFFAFDAFDSVLALYGKELGQSAFFIGSVLGVGNALRMVLAVPMGHLGDAYGRKWFALGILLVLGAALLGLSAVTRPVAVFALALVVVVSRTPFNVMLNPMLAYAVSSEQRGRAFGVRDVFLYGGSTAGVCLAGLWVVYGYRALFLVLGCLILLAVPLALGLRDARERRKEQREAEAEASASREKKSWRAAFAELRRHRVVTVFAVVLFLCSLAGGSLMLVALKGQRIGIPVDAILYTVAGSNLLAVLLSYLGGRMTDAFDRRLLFMGSLAVTMTFYLSLCVAQSYIGFAVAMLLQAVMLVFAPVLSVYFFEFFPEEIAGKAFGVMTTFGLIGESFSTLLAGALWEGAAWPELAFAVAAVLVGLALVVTVVWVPRTYVPLRARR